MACVGGCNFFNSFVTFNVTDCGFIVHKYIVVDMNRRHGHDTSSAVKKIFYAVEVYS